MSKLVNRLVSSTALAGALVGFYNLPAKAENELSHGADQEMAQVRTVSSKVQPIEIKKNSKVSADEDDFVIIDNTEEKKTSVKKSDQQEDLSRNKKLRQFKEVGAGQVNQEEAQAVKDRELNINFEPLVVKNNAQLEFSDTFHKIKEVTLLANHYAYCEVKGNVQLAGKALAQLEAMGCKRIGTFSALEGKHLNFGTVAGSVFYNSAENMYFIVWHGTASNEEGWQTNFDNQLISANQLVSNVYEIMRNEIVTSLRNEKGLFISGTEDEQITEIMGYVKANLTTDLTIDELLKLRDSIKQKVSEAAPKLANKAPSKKEVSILEKIDAIFAVKMQLLGKQDYIVQELKAATVTALSNRVEALNSLLTKSDDEKLKRQASQNIQALKTIIQQVRSELPKCKTPQQVENFMADLQTEIDTKLSANQGTIQKIFRGKNSMATMQKELTKELEHILDIRSEQISLLGKAHELSYKGKTHRGYTLKVASADNQIENMIKKHAKSLSDDLRQRVRTVITGHSMAGALAKIHAADFRESYRRIFGHLPTAANNRLMVHALSAAPTGDYTFAKGLEHNLGLGNIVDQKVDKDLVPKADPAAFVPDNVKQVAGMIPWAGQELVSRMDSDYAPQIGTPAIDKVEVVKARAEKNFPGKVHPWWKPFSIPQKIVVLPHYGINLGDKQPDGETYGRDDHFEPALARAETPQEWNGLLQQGGMKATDAFQAKRITLASK